MLWEVTRAAIHCDVDLTRLYVPFDESWKDQETFWSSLKNIRSFKGRRFPAKSDPRAWRVGINDDFDGDNQAVIFTATFNTTDAMTGPPLKLGLEPLKCEQSSRLFRRFGADRFLEIRVPSLESWQTDEDDLEGTVAQWLANNRHSFLDRHWSAFYVRDRPMKSQPENGLDGREAKAVFYDRVLFFAEASAKAPASRSLSAIVSRTEMLDWLLALKDQDGQSYLKLFHRVSLGIWSLPPNLHSLYFVLTV